LEAALDAAERHAEELKAQLQSESESYKNKLEEWRKKLAQKTE